jgi:hypothetical protein
VSTGGAKPHSSLLPDATRVDFDQAWRDREQEAALLISGGYHSMGQALRVYSLEIRLKEYICRHLKLEHLPKACKTHDLMELIIFTSLWAELSDPANLNLRTNWDVLARFSKIRLNEIRYQPSASFDAVESAELTAALDDPIHGVLAWLSGRP